uniref:Uncharacterized protein n=1 Tax=Oryzias latipes TaxID=8090 RepID=A0A3P9JTV0_ORYLA
ETGMDGVVLQKKSMFGARKKFSEFPEILDDFSDDSMYYSQPSMFAHRSDKDVSMEEM